MASLLSPAGFTVIELVVAVVTAPLEVSDAVIVKLPAVLICSPLKLATPLTAATEVVPAAKLPEDRATWMVSVEPVLPVVTTLLNWSSMVTPTETVPPAVMGPAGWALMTNLLGRPGFTVNELVTVWVTVAFVVSVAV